MSKSSENTTVHETVPEQVSQNETELTSDNVPEAEQQVRRLKFIHITKTGGTSIENIAKDHNVRWGRFDNELMFLGKSSFWHRPFRKSNDEMAKKHIIDNYDLFAVVRDPYTRCVSEYFCKWGGPQNNHHTKKQLNNYISKRLRDLMRKRSKITPGGHFTPQFTYIYDGKGNKHVKHVIKFENLQEEFDALMEQYHLPIRLNRFDNVSTKNLSVNDLDESTKKLIQQVYKRDFKEFGYNM